jgi:hypothetical protein
MRRMRIVAVFLIFGSDVAHAGCPNDYRKLDERARQATEAFNAADIARRCEKARQLVDAERKLFHFVEEYQVRCVLDQEIIDVQQRRLAKAGAALDRACGGSPALER